MQARGIVEALVVVTMAVTSAALVYGLMQVQQPGVDFAPIWAAASDPPSAYDAAAMTRAQQSYVDTLHNLRPFAYPPTGLLIFLPFALLSFWPAFALFVTAGLGLFAWPVRQSAWWVAIAPPVIVLVHVGQASLFVGAALSWALVARDWRRGVLIGIAAAIKPQLCLFIPLVLMFDRDWRNVATAACTWAGLVIVATAMFGIASWSEWIASAHTVLETVQARPEFAEKMLRSDPMLLPFSIASLWLTRRSASAIRMSACVGAALLVAPYAMTYELALLLPGIAVAAKRHAFMLVAALGLGLFYPVGTPLVMLVLCGFVICEVLDTEKTARRAQGPGLRKEKTP